MRLAFISDIHSNLLALKAVYEDLSKQGVDKIYCLGDSIGYLTDPNGVLDFIKSHGIISILGNHDEKYINKTKLSPEDLALLSEKDLQKSGSFHYNNQILTDENRTYLEGLPRQLELDIAGYKILLVHGSPAAIAEYMYEEDDKSKFYDLPYDLIIFGHTHLPYYQKKDQIAFLNPGSVGKPKHGDPMSSYAVLDTSSREVAFKKVAYDLEALTKVIKEEAMISDKLIDDLKQ